MIRLALLASLLAVACGDIHLGDDYGKKTRAILAAQQATASTEDALTLDAADAKLILMRHRDLKEVQETYGGGAPSSSSGAPMAMPAAPADTGGAGSGVGGLQNNGPMMLQAK